MFWSLWGLQLSHKFNDYGSLESNLMKIYMGLWSSRVLRVSQTLGITYSQFFWDGAAACRHMKSQTTTCIARMPTVIDTSVDDLQVQVTDGSLCALSVGSGESRRGYETLQYDAMGVSPYILLFRLRSHVVEVLRPEMIIFTRRAA